MTGRSTMNPYTNLHSKLDRDQIVVRDNVLRLADMTDKAIENAMRALTETDIALAQEVVNGDEAINHFRHQIEQGCYRLLATQQPTARDMRSFITAIHVAVELERIADHASGIAKLTLEIVNTQMIKPPVELAAMTKIARDMLTSSLDAYVNWDDALAWATFKRDDEVDQLNQQIHHKLVALMTNDGKTIACATYLLWISHNLERIADRITNICERVIFLVTGKIPTEVEG